MKKLVLVLLVTSLLGMACSKTKKVSYAESTEGLKSLSSDILAAQKSGDKEKLSSLLKSLQLPDAEVWFKQVFGDDKGAKAAAQYKTNSSQMDSELGRLFEKIVNEGQTDIRVLRLEKADDPQATGNQKDALTAMKNPVPLYSVRFVKPGEALGQHLYNWVYVDGTFRLVGKMDAVKG